MTIIILGGGITSKETLPKQVKERLKKAKEYFDKNKSNVLVCGKYSLDFDKDSLPEVTEAELMKKYLIKLGIPRDKIFKEEKSRDSISNAYYSKKLYFIPKEEKEAIIFTSDYHIKRVKYIFKKMFGSKYNFKFIGTPSPFNEVRNKKIIERQKKLLEETKEITKDMKDCDHDFWNDKFYKINYYKKEKPEWVIELVAKGK